MNLNNKINTNKLKNVASILIIFCSFLLFGNEYSILLGQNVDYEFVEYIKSIDSTAILKESIFPDENFFLFLSCETDREVYLDWMHLDNIYIIGIIQRMFPENQEITTSVTYDFEITSTITITTNTYIGTPINMFVYNKETNQFLLFYLITNPFLGCKKIIRLFDLMLFDNIMVFDKNHKYIGYFRINFTSFDFPTLYEKVIYKNNNTYSYEFDAKKLYIFKCKQYEYLTNSGFRKLLDILMYYINEHPIDIEELEKFVPWASHPAVRKIESVQQKTPFTENNLEKSKNKD